MALMSAIREASVSALPTLNCAGEREGRWEKGEGKGEEGKGKRERERGEGEERRKGGKNKFGSLFEGTKK
jgi:hypothetical protein